MTLGERDKRVDGAAHSPSPSPTKHRVGRDAATWDDPSLFGGEGEATLERENAGDRRAQAHTGKVPSPEPRERRLSE